MDEHWDGGGYPYGLRRDQAPLFARIIGLAQVMEIFWGEGGPTHALAVAASAAAAGSIPISSTRCDDLEARHARSGHGWPRPARSATCSRTSRADLEIPADDGRLDRIADAFALIIDAKSPFTFDHSRRVATLRRSRSTRGSATAPSMPSGCAAPRCSTTSAS